MASPDRGHLYAVAAQQQGYFSRTQAQEAGFSPQLLGYYVKTGSFERVRRGIYRLVEYPPGEHDDLTILWLWSRRRGVFSHSTALSLHELSDLLPERIHLTLPEAERGARRATPRGLRVHFADIAEEDRTWYDGIPITNPAKTLEDCIEFSLSPDLLEQAMRQAVERGLLELESITTLMSRLENMRGRS